MNPSDERREENDHDTNRLPALCKKIVIAATGSVGVVGLPDLVSTLRRGLVDEVHVVMSEAARRFVTDYCMEVFSGNEVLTNVFEYESSTVPHLTILGGADLLLVMPSTANIIGKAANGIADDAVSTMIIAAECPVVFVPLMNDVMWRNPAVQRNVKRIKEYGHHIVEPTQGVEVATMDTSSRDVHEGMAGPQNLFEHLARILQSKTTRSPREHL